MFKKLIDEATIPERASEKSLGYDLVATSLTWTDNGDVVTYHTGIALSDIPEGYFAALFPRSSVVNTDLRLANSVGVIDPDYTGEILVKFDVPKVASQVLSKGNAKFYRVGEKIAQIVFLPYLLGGDIVQEPRTGGFGSTGVKPKKPTKTVVG